MAKNSAGRLSRRLAGSFERTVNGGKSWQRIGPINEGRTIHAIQPSILIQPCNRLQALGRTQEGHLHLEASANQACHRRPVETDHEPNREGPVA